MFWGLWDVMASVIPACDRTRRTQAQRTNESRAIRDRSFKIEIGRAVTV